MVNSKDLKLIDWDKDIIWHPFTQMADWVKDEPTAPLIIRSGKGNYIFDIYGRRYIDGVSSLWVTVHGHRTREIDNAINNQLKKIAHSTFLGLTHEPAILLAKELIDLVPSNLKKVFFSDNGSTAVEIALKMAYQYWQQVEKDSKRRYFLSIKNAYHGDTLGSVSVGGIDIFHSKFRSLLFDTFFAPSPYCYRCIWKGKRDNSLRFNSIWDPRFYNYIRDVKCRGECILELESILKENHHKIVAGIIEPLIQAAAGMITMPSGYLKTFEKLLKRYNIFLICDEVATGFGRTGTMFAIEQEDIKPDFLCLAKGITGGYLPLAVTITTEKVYNAFLGRYEDYKTFFHGHTYTANPLACAAALANLKIFKKKNVINSLDKKVVFLANELKMLSDIPWVGDIRQKGLMVGIEIVQDRKSKKEFPPKDKIGIKICARCRSYGLILRPLGNVIVIMPPLSITCSEIRTIVSIIKKAIIDILGKSD